MTTHTRSQPARRGAGSATKMVLGQPSWRLASSTVETYVTQTGGHLAPVTFDRTGAKIQPLSVAPWATEDIDRAQPPIIRALRGDFFCMPFGGNDVPYRGERHPPHGEPANSKWTFESSQRLRGRGPGNGEPDIHELHLSLRTRVRPGRVDKRIWLVDGHHAVYQSHRVSGMSGPMDFGHHAMLKFPDEPGSGIISTSPFVYGQVYPEPIERPENRGYSILKPGATFDSLEKVPMITGETTDLTRYPARRGFEDLVMIVADEANAFAWTAVTFPKQRYVWLALKDPRVLRSTVFWISNGGRHYAPWSGRHLNVMGLEEVTAYFHPGLAQSAAPNPLSKKGFATSVQLDPDEPLVVNYVMAVAKIPAGFDRVATVEQTSGDRVTVVSDSGKRVHVPLLASFLHEVGQ